MGARLPSTCRGLQAAVRSPHLGPMKTELKRTFVVVSHTHWDREWYRPFEGFRMRLVRVLDKLLGLLDRDPQYRHFVLDGQTIVLDDYLEGGPERRADLEGVPQ